VPSWSAASRITCVRVGPQRFLHFREPLKNARVIPDAVIGDAELLVVDNLSALPRSGTQNRGGVLVAGSELGAPASAVGYRARSAAESRRRLPAMTGGSNRLQRKEIAGSGGSEKPAARSKAVINVVAQRSSTRLPQGTSPAPTST
jgi:hypothetical protein